MAEASGDVLALAMPGGRAEATRMGRAEAGQSRWRIAFPWGAETFFGDSGAAAAHARKRAAAAAPTPGGAGAAGAEDHRSGRA